MPTHAPLVIDIAGLQLSRADQRRLRHPLVGGVILFARNWQDRLQLTDLCGAIRHLRRDLLILVDHEGGRVQRFRTGGFTHLPPMRTLGQLWQGQPGGDPARSALHAMRAATACGYVLGAELRACGVDMSFTPVLDLDHGSSGVIGDRAFSPDPAVVSVLARSLMQGLLQSGMANCGKHFPGHGFVAADSHTDVPIDRRGLGSILAADAAPYGTLGTALASVMPAHVIYPRVDPLPAGFSPRWLQDILRRQLGFTGAIFSDDLSMEGARSIGGELISHTQAAVAALNAGCDMVLLCNQCLDGNTAIDTLIHGLAQGLRVGQWSARPASEQRRLALLPPPFAFDWDALMVQPLYMRSLDLIP